MTPFTIVMPVFRQPNFLHQALTGIKRNSTANPKIIVVWTRAEEFAEFDQRRGVNNAPASDFLINSEGQREKRYASIQEYMDREALFLQTLDIYFYEANEEGWTLRNELGDSYIDGTDSAYKINLGIEMAETEFIIPNYDADFYPSPGWDKGLLNAIEFADNPLHTFISTHIQPNYEEGIGLRSAVDSIEETRRRHCTHLAWLTDSPEGTVQEDHWRYLCNSIRRKEFIVEPCGQRSRTHWNPQGFRLSEFREHIKGFPWGTGTDMHVDDIAGRAGFTKVSTYESFILHKAGIAGIF